MGTAIWHRNEPSGDVTIRATRVAHLPDPQALVLERYEPIRRLGSGGFGTVWLARDTKLGRLVALKRIPISDPAVAERARREAVAAARLQHTSIVSLYECATDEEAFYLVSEHVSGATLGELEQEGALSDLDVLEIGRALCEALDHAHRRGVVHRDVKPHNVMVADTPAADGTTLAKLTDFGIARLIGDDALTATGDVVGTLAYMSPEQAEGHEATEASDLYSLALCLYEAFSGVNPIRARGAAATVRRVGSRLPSLGRLRRDLPLELTQAIDAAVSPAPADRGTLGDLRAALDEAADEVGDRPGLVSGTAIGTLGLSVPGQRATIPERAIAAGSAAVLAYLGFANLPPDAPLAPLWLAALAAILCGALPRLGWLTGLTAICAWLAASGYAGIAALLACAALPVAGVLFATSWAWSLSAGAPILAVGGVAGMFTSLAGQLPRAWDRFALGAAGAWCVLLVAPLTGSGLRAQGSAPALSQWQGSVTDAFDVAIVPVLSSAAIAVCAIWGVAALLLPWLVRGRHLAIDIVAATTWAATTAAATQAACAPDADGVVLGAILAGCAALAAAVVRGTTRDDLT